MCIFSGPVYDVSETKIFCRVKEGRQTLVYSMDVEFDNPVAMVLPIPTKSHKEDAVTFINLKEKADFFKELDKPFEVRTRGMSKGLCASPLKVHEVGNYIASFVPHRLFFERLDEAFRLNDSIWDKLPQYANFGFAVFQLKSENRGAKNHYHPMGFTFPIKNENEIFFPTVHIHDGEVPDRGDFDHAIYWQFDKDIKRFLVKETSGVKRGQFVEFDDNYPMIQKSSKTALAYTNSELVDPNMVIYKANIYGEKENKDLYVA